jgi:all-trans-8'-apo-beta-carotenal 15,15'-oxygenase
MNSAKLFESLRNERSFAPLRVEGRIPDELRGTLYRGGPALFDAQGTRYRHLFDGDGAVSALRLEGGKAQGAVKVVQTAGLLAEREAGRMIYGSYGTPSPKLADRFKQMTKNSANTSVMLWQGRLFAMLEACPPTEISREDLSTLGENDLEGAVIQSFSAHPHLHQPTGNLYNFGVRHGRETLLDLFELPRAGKARKIASIPLSRRSMIHDFMVTDRYAVFVVPPLSLSLRQVLGMGVYSENLRWVPELGTEIMVVDLAEPSRVRRFLTEAFYQWHFLNGYEEGGELVLDLIRYRDLESTHRWFQQTIHGGPKMAANGRVHRGRLDLSKGRARWEEVSPVSVELPTVASAVSGKPYRHAYMVGHSSPDVGREAYDVIVKADLAKVSTRQLSLGRGTYPGEPIFVPRQGARHEDDGYLISLVYDANREVSCYAILDAANFEGEPLARAWLEQPMPISFHGTWEQKS